MKKFIPVFLLLLVAFSASIMFSACEKTADDQIIAAEDAIKSAINAGADESSPKLLGKARTKVQEAKMLNEQGDYNQAHKKAYSALLNAQGAEKNATRLSEAKND